MFRNEAISGLLETLLHITSEKKGQCPFLYGGENHSLDTVILLCVLEFLTDFRLDHMEAISEDVWWGNVTNLISSYLKLDEESSLFPRQKVEALNLFFNSAGKRFKEIRSANFNPKAKATVGEFLIRTFKLMDLQEQIDLITGSYVMSLCTPEKP